MPRVDRRFILNTRADLLGRREIDQSRIDWAYLHEVDLGAVTTEVQRQLAGGEIDLVSVGVDLFQLGYEVHRAQAKASVLERCDMAEEDAKRQEQMRVEADEVLKRTER